MTKFEKKVFSVVKKIPVGRVATYGFIAKAVGRSNAAHSVGTVLSKNYDPAIPCHRIVCFDGSLGGYNRGLRHKIKILREEGIEVKYGRIDLKKFGWKKM